MRIFTRNDFFNWSSCALKFHGGASVISEIAFLGWKFFSYCQIGKYKFWRYLFKKKNVREDEFIK